MKFTSAPSRFLSVLSRSKQLLTNQRFPTDHIATDLCNPSAQIIQTLTNEKVLQSSVFFIQLKHVTSEYQHRFCSFGTFIVLWNKDFKHKTNSDHVREHVTDLMAGYPFITERKIVIYDQHGQNRHFFSLNSTVYIWKDCFYMGECYYPSAGYKKRFFTMKHTR